jgi:hypothetical protein
MFAMSSRWELAWVYLGSVVLVTATAIANPGAKIYAIERNSTESIALIIDQEN